MKTYSYKELGAAYVRGEGQRQDIGLPEELMAVPLEELSEDQKDELVALGKTAELKMHYFKEKNELPRVQLVLGFLQGMVASGQVRSLLDVGSGRGAFLFPLLTRFPELEVTSIDILPHRVELLHSVEVGGVSNLHTLERNLCEWDAPAESFDAVTLLEVLEHIPEVERAVKAAVKMARKYVVVSVPSKEDDNPEHIHLLTKDILTKLFADAGCTKLHFGGVNGHLIMMATIE